METLFGLVTILPLPVWGAMLLFPRTRFTQRLVTATWPFIALGAVYAVLAAGALVAGALPLSLSFEALRTAAAGPWAFVAAWAHLLAFDLFVGVWIFRDAKYWNVNAAPFLLATLIAGPIGLGAYLVARERRDRTDPIRNLN